MTTGDREHDIPDGELARRDPLSRVVVDVDLTSALTHHEDFSRGSDDATLDSRVHMTGDLARAPANREPDL
ncbi:MAG TPA: hypothetical protein VGT40_08135 [Methylomirabilota bacterium]|nr:hypothetical protein [Methylomirabilota bacterium]